MWIIEAFEQMIGEDSDKPPSEKKLAIQMGGDGRNRCDSGFKYLTIIFLCRNTIWPKRLVSTTLGNTGNNHLL